MTSLLRFLGIGVVNTLVGYGVILAGLRAGLGDYAANAAGYGVGMIVSYGLQRRWAFAVRRAPSWREGMRFGAAVAVAYAANLAVIHLGRSVLELERDPWVQAGALATYTLTFYAIARWFVFGRAS